MSDRKRQILYSFAYMWNENQTKTNEHTKTKNKLIEVDNRSVVTGGEGE